MRRGKMAEALEKEPGLVLTAMVHDIAMALRLLERQGEGHVDADVVLLDAEVAESAPEHAAMLRRMRPKMKILLLTEESSTLTSELMQSLALGPSNCMVRPAFGDTERFAAFLQECLAMVQTLHAPKVASKARAGQQDEAFALRPAPTVRPEVLAIGSSTGGPQALYTLFGALKGKQLRVPLCITQHMPPRFTTLLAENLSTVSGLHCHEAEEGMRVQAGHVYLARGDHHMLLVREKDQGVVLQTPHTPPENFCRPAVDPMLRSLVALYGKRVMLVMLTGMGTDGLIGAGQVVEAGGTVLAQDRESSVVWGMPGAVAEAGLCSAVVPMEQMAKTLCRLSQGALE